MTSILTNTSSMVALQTLKGINNNLETIQNEISTGKTVSSAKDNASVWAISKVMESDVQGFQAISESLALGESTIAVAREASETVTDLLTEIKEKIVGAQEENVDRSKLQDDIDALTDQISSIASAAQFNGLNLIQGSDSVNILSSLDRASDGSVTSASISVDRQDLTFDAGVYNASGTDLSGNTSDSAAAAVNTAVTEVLTLSTAQAVDDVLRLQIGDTTVSYTATTTTLNDAADGLTAAINAAGIEGISATVSGAAITLSSTVAFEDTDLTFGSTGSTTGAYTGDNKLEARAETVTFSATAGVSEGDGYRVTIGSQDFDYVAGKGESFEDVARGLKIAIDGAGLGDISTNVTQDSSTGEWILQVDNDGSSLAFSSAGRSDGTATGGLAGVNDIDVTTDEGVSAALSNIETWIDSAIEAAAAFGSAEGRIETQSEFISNLTDSLKSGIGSMVDADMEEASAKLQALQVQQQLGIQALSIANQSPQSVLSLFQ
ncbi:flagellin [Tropicimonas marinistellae]|uniref:flagellin n=1 Tax=Tropicimonas marinistellae TaxID=1739787 RepID=UPI00082AC28F|nr:flagellin [Tropicimonas marinistellae]